MDVKLRQFVRIRAGQHCEYCGLAQEFSEMRFHIEHVTPRQHGGDDDADNLALACPDGRRFEFIIAELQQATGVI